MLFKKVECPSKSLLGVANTLACWNQTWQWNLCNSWSPEWTSQAGVVNHKSTPSLLRCSPNFPGRQILPAWYYVSSSSSLCCSVFGIPAWDWEPTLPGGGSFAATISLWPLRHCTCLRRALPFHDSPPLASLHMAFSVLLKYTISDQLHFAWFFKLIALVLGWEQGHATSSYLAAIFFLLGKL